MAFRCTADSGLNGVATGIQRCFLKGSSGAEYHPPGRINALPGSRAVEAGAAVEIPRQAFQLCVKSAALWQDNTFFETTLACG